MFGDLPNHDQWPCVGHEYWDIGEIWKYADTVYIFFFHPSYWNARKIDRTNYVSFRSLYWNPNKTDGQTTVHFTPHIGIQVRRTDNLRFISPLLLESTQRRNKDGQTTFHFIPHNWIYARQTWPNNASFHPQIWIYTQDRLRFIASLVLESK